MVLAAAFDVYILYDPLRSPLRLPEQLRLPAEGSNARRVATGDNPIRGLIATIGDRLTIEVIRASGHELTALFAHNRDREPLFGLLCPRDLLLDAADIFCMFQCCANERVHLTRAIELGGVVVVGDEASSLMHGDELCAKIFGIVIEARFRRRYCIERLAQMFSKFRLIEITRDGVEGVEVVQLIAVLVRDSLLT